MRLHLHHFITKNHTRAVCCSVLQCVAVCCTVLQCVAVCCRVLQYVAVVLSVFTSASLRSRESYPCMCV